MWVSSGIHTIYAKAEGIPMRNSGISRIVILIMAMFLLPIFAKAQDAAELAKKLANPVSSLISVPIQSNYDTNIGSSKDGSVWRINIQPVVPIALNNDWNLISRTILPVIDQSNVPSLGMGESGIGDIVQSLFFSPQKPTSRGVIWGAGPVFMLPTASNRMLGSEKWGIGPTAVVLKQVGPWTIGGLVNHIESFAGDSDRADVSATFMQPFVTYVTKTKTTLALNTESTYDWENEAWSVPINMSLAQMLKIGPQIIQVGAGARYWADSPGSGPKGWGARINLVFLFPR
jgi:hypothetical protein